MQHQYTLPQVDALKPKFKEMIQALIYRMVSYGNWKDVSDTFIWDVDDNLFNFKVTTNAFHYLVKDAKDNAVALNAAFFPDIIPFTFTVDVTDMQKDLDEVLTPETLEKLTDAFIVTIKQGMVRRWLNDTGISREYSYLLRDGRFMEARDYINMGLYATWGPEGYEITLHSDDGKLISKSTRYVRSSDTARHNCNVCVNESLHTLFSGIAQGLGYNDQLTSSLFKDPAREI